MRDRWFSFFFFLFILISWRLITSQHFSGFCHTLDRWFSRHSGDHVRPSCRMSASMVASALMPWGGEKQKPRHTSVPSAGILPLPEARGSSREGGVSLARGQPSKRSWECRQGWEQGPACSSCCPAPVGTLSPKDASHQMTHGPQ